MINTLRHVLPAMTMLLPALFFAVLAGDVQAAVAGKSAESYPNRPVRFVVPFSPGGTNDLVARFLAARLSAQTGQQFIVDNRAGAGGLIGTETVAKSTPDGYTLLLASGPLTVAPALHKKLPFDVARDFVGVSGVSTSPVLMVRNPNTGFRTVSELVTQAKAKPESIRYGSGGVGSTPHLAMELFQSVTGTRLNHISYKGGGPSMAALAAGEVDVIINSITTLLPFVEQGRIRAIAVCQQKRSTRLPEVPTLLESGVKDYSMQHWVGVVAQAKTPEPLLKTLRAQINAALSSKEMIDRLVTAAAEPYVQSKPDDFHRFMLSELQVWQQVVKRAGITPE